MRKPILVANWKMQGTADFIPAWVSIVKSAAEAVETIQLVLCPSAVYLPITETYAQNSKLAWGAQDVSAHEPGAFTGQISASMLKEFNCRYVIMGHSERRRYNHETDHVIAEKFFMAQEEGLIPILCVGETADEYKANQTEAVITRQLQAVIKHVGIAAFGSAVIAYEPVWAIGTGLSATPAHAQQTHEMIRAYLSEEDIDIASHISILYGGSLNAENAAALFAETDIDGGLVGGASLDADIFSTIAKTLAVQKQK